MCWVHSQLSHSSGHTCTSPHGPRARPSRPHLPGLSCWPGVLILAIAFVSAFALGTTAVRPTSPFCVFPKISSKTYCQATVLQAFSVPSVCCHPPGSPHTVLCYASSANGGLFKNLGQLLPYLSKRGRDRYPNSTEEAGLLSLSPFTRLWQPVAGPVLL